MSRSIWVRLWQGEQDIVLEWAIGSELKGWSREDGRRIIETNGDPVFQDDEGFEAAWAAQSLEAQP